MYIRKVEKKNKNRDKTYSYYRLVHGYKVGAKVRQQTLLNLGKLEEVPRDLHKTLADRIEMLLTGTESIFSPENSKIEVFAQKFAKEIELKGLFPSKKRKTAIGKVPETNYEEIALDSIENDESREIGGEWLCKQAFDRFKLDDILKEAGLNEAQTAMAQMLLTAKLLHPSSELESERWLKENSGAMELYGEEQFSTTRYRLYQAGALLYSKKDMLENLIYSQCETLFSNRSKIVIYDLTNMYFEGRMENSVKANFGRSKEKRSDCRLIGLALAIDSNGFVRHSQIYPGNVSEPSTLKSMLDDVKDFLNDKDEKTVVVMDAGIATEENLKLVKKYDCDYVCVSRKHPKQFDKIVENATIIKDNCGNKIAIQKVSVDDTTDSFLHIKSAQKIVKEESMSKKITERFEERLIYLKNGLSLPRRIKKIAPVHEAIGRIKNQFSKVAKLYKIEYKEDKKKGVITDIEWTKQDKKDKSKGEYFIRYSKNNLTETQIWDVYNLTRDVEASFRCLKTDLNIRPIHHQKDAYIEPHIWLGIIAYQFVNYIRNILKEKDINYSWTTIVEKMKTQKVNMISMTAKNNKRIFAKLCTRPSDDVKKIYDALTFKSRPYTRKIKVVTQM